MNRPNHGRSLLEMLIVIAIMSMIAAIAAPTLTSEDPQKLDLAASEFADALRFARQESIRTGIPHGVTPNVTADQYRIFRLDLGTAPATWVFDVYHPVAKQLYTIEVNEGPTRGVSISQAPVSFTAACNNANGFAFGSVGNPICTDPLTSPVASAQATFSQGGVDKIVSVSPMTGRVTSQ